MCVLKPSTFQPSACSAARYFEALVIPPLEARGSKEPDRTSAEGSQLRTPLADMDDSIEAAKTFVEVQLEDAEVKLAPELRTPEKALAAAREVVAQRLAVEPEVRRQARQHFETHAIYVVKPTSKGRDEVDQAHPYFRVRSEFHGRTRSLIEMRPGPAPYEEPSTIKG